MDSWGQIGPEKPDFFADLETSARLADLDVGDVVLAPDNGEWPIVEVFREPRFQMLVSATIERSGVRHVLDATELDWIGYGLSATSRWRWHPAPSAYQGEGR